MEATALDASAVIDADSDVSPFPIANASWSEIQRYVERGIQLPTTRAALSGQLGFTTTSPVNLDGSPKSSESGPGEQTFDFTTFIPVHEQIVAHTSEFRSSTVTEIIRLANKLVVHAGKVQSGYPALQMAVDRWFEAESERDRGIVLSGLEFYRRSAESNRCAVMSVLGQIQDFVSATLQDRGRLDGLQASLNAELYDGQPPAAPDEDVLDDDDIAKLNELEEAGVLPVDFPEGLIDRAEGQSLRLLKMIAEQLDIVREAEADLARARTVAGTSVVYLPFIGVPPFGFLLLVAAGVQAGVGGSQVVQAADALEAASQKVGELSRRFVIQISAQLLVENGLAEVDQTLELLDGAKDQLAMLETGWGNIRDSLDAIIEAAGDENNTEAFSALVNLDSAATSWSMLAEEAEKWGDSARVSVGPQTTTMAA